jgi:8-oxo-dGTP diphosphatase
MARRREYPRLPTVGAGALIHSRGKVLLIKRRNEPNKGRWALPGGLVEVGETVQQAILREVREEVALEVKLEGLLDVADDVHYDKEGRVRFHYVLVDYLAKPTGGTPKVNAESSGFRWFDPREVALIDTSESTKRVVELFLKKNGRAPLSHRGRG